MQALFRQEVMEAQRGSWLGSITLAQPLSVRVSTSLAVAVVVLILVFLATSSYTERTTVDGQLVPVGGITAVSSPEAGFIEELRVSEGDMVDKGEPLATIRVPRFAVGSGDTTAALANQLDRRAESIRRSREASLLQLSAKTDGLRGQISSALAEHEQIRAEITVRQEQIKIANQTLEQFNQLVGEGYVSELQVAQQMSTVLNFKSEVESLRRQSNSLLRQLSQLRQSLGEANAEHESVSADIERESAVLEQERVRLDADGTSVLRAPLAGMVINEILKKGQTVQVGTAVLNIASGAGKLEAELNVPSRAIGSIKLGDKVRLRYTAYPYQRYGHQLGTVSSISLGALENSDSSAQQLSAAGGEPYYKVVVAIESQTVPGRSDGRLRPGLTVEADILGDSRSLIAWMLQPTQSLSDRMRRG